MQKKGILFKLNLFIRSLIFAIYLALLILFFSLLLCIFYFISPLHIRCKIVVYFAQTSLWGLKVICNVNYRVEGLENIPKDRNGVILSKHQSTWETFYIPTIFHDPAIITKRELLWIPFFGWGFATIAPIAINRSDKATAMEQVITKGTQFLKQGRWIMVFPEGTRIPVGKVGNYRLGGARLAIAAGGYPVLPIAHNAGHFWKKNTFLRYPGTVHVVIGPIIETLNRKPEEVMEEAKNWIENTILRIEKEAKHE